MKVLTTDGGKVVLSLPMSAAGFEKHTGDGTAEKGIVAEWPEGMVKRQFQVAAARPDNFLTTADYMRDARFIHKCLVDVPVGTEVGFTFRGSKVGLDIPKDARPEKVAAKAGDRIAINHTISPKALMNTHGTVVKVNGTKVVCELDEGDLKRVERATGKRFTNPCPVPKACVEVIA